MHLTVSSLGLRCVKNVTDVYYSRVKFDTLKIVESLMDLFLSFSFAKLRAM